MKSYYSIGKLFIDNRSWYQIYEDGKWSNIWYAQYEIDEIIKRDNKLPYRKMGWVHHNFLHNKTKISRFGRIILILFVGIIIGYILKSISLNT